MGIRVLSNRLFVDVEGVAETLGFQAVRNGGRSLFRCVRRRGVDADTALAISRANRRDSRATARKGKGVVQDFREAYFWANLAAAGAHRTLPESFVVDYDAFRDRVAARLRPVQLSAVQKRCRQWMDVFEKRTAEKPQTRSGE